MEIKDKISFAINQISVNNCDGSANENGIKAVRYLQEVHEALSRHDIKSEDLIKKIDEEFETYAYLPDLVELIRNFNQNK